MYKNKDDAKENQRKRRKELGDKYKSQYKKYNKSKAEYNRIRQLNKYNLSIDDYNYLFEIQEGRCSICGKHQSECKRALAVDHNHSTGKIRGLLCPTCNLALGCAQDNIDILHNMIKYLENGK